MFEDRGQKESVADLWGSNRIMFLQNRVLCNSNFLFFMLTQKQCGSISSFGGGGGTGVRGGDAFGYYVKMKKKIKCKIFSDKMPGAAVFSLVCVAARSIFILISF